MRLWETADWDLHFTKPGHEQKLIRHLPARGIPVSLLFSDQGTQGFERSTSLSRSHYKWDLWLMKRQNTDVLLYPSPPVNQRSRAQSRPKLQLSPSLKYMHWFSLPAVMFYKIGHKHWISQHWAIAPEENTAPGSCQLPFAVFLSTNEYITLCDVSFCLKTPSLIYIIGSLTWNAWQQWSNSRLHEALGTHVFSPQGTSQPPALRNTRQLCSTSLGGHLILVL